MAEFLKQMEKDAKEAGLRVTNGAQAGRQESSEPREVVLANGERVAIVSSTVTEFELPPGHGLPIGEYLLQVKNKEQRTKIKD